MFEGLEKGVFLIGLAGGVFKRGWGFVNGTRVARDVYGAVALGLDG